MEKYILLVCDFTLAKKINKERNKVGKLLNGKNKMKEY